MDLTVASQADAPTQELEVISEDQTAPLFDLVERPSKLVVFGFDSAEISQVRRIRSLIAMGHDVQAFTMRRGDGPVETDFPNIHLCFSAHEKLGQRIFLVAASVLKSLRHRDHLGQADLIIARNLDMLAIAWASRLLSRNSEIPLVYECLDIHRAMVHPGLGGRVMRWAERQLLKKCCMLTVSSSAYLDEYFTPYQGYDGPAALWENKVIPAPDLAPRPRCTKKETAGPIRLGWVGAIRCGLSFDLLIQAAEALGDRVEIHIHGIVHRHAIPDFDRQIADLPNIIYHGPYAYPGDLAQVYGGIDVVWNIDLWLRGGNSDWALSNRLYEAGYCGCPSIALAGTAIGDRVQTENWGWILSEPTVDALTGLLNSLSQADLQQASQSILSQPAETFVADGSDLQQVVDALT
jgi:succinoglycan biosynthesis protein ExoL